MVNLSKRQLDILKVSAHIIVNKGLHGFKMRDVSQHLGLAETTIYKHFKTREILINALSEHIKSFFETMFSDILKSDKSILEKLELLFFAWCESLEKNPNYNLLVNNIYNQLDGGSFQDFRKLLLSYFDAIIKTLEQGQKNGEIRSDLDTTHLF